MINPHKSHATFSQLNNDKRTSGAKMFQMNIRPLDFKDATHQCLEAQATWNVLGGDEGSYEVSPLISDDSEPYAWEASYYTDHRNCYGQPVNRDAGEYSTKQEAIDACQRHNRERCIAMIGEMLA